MPLFEFTCKDCGCVFEELLSHAELAAGRIACPGCESVRVDRSLSAFATGGTADAGGGGGCGGGACGGKFT